MKLTTRQLIVLVQALLEEQNRLSQQIQESRKAAYAANTEESFDWELDALMALQQKRREIAQISKQIDQEMEKRFQEEDR